MCLSWVSGREVAVSRSTRMFGVTYAGDFIADKCLLYHF